MSKPHLATLAILFTLTCPARASEKDALAIDAAIQARHMPFGTILDPMYDSATGTQIIGYTRCGDSALWTGAYLAAEAFRYKVTQSADALRNVKSALAGLTNLSAITGDNRLARCMVPADSPFAAGIESEEAVHTMHQNPPWVWVDDTSRDQVVGAFFGLGAAFDMVDDPAVKSGISNLATLLIGYISRHQWSPNDDITSTFELRPDELQMLLQVARHVNPSNTVSGPFFVPPVNTGILVDVQSNGSYYKFNLDYMTFFNLGRLQGSSSNQDAYKALRDYTASHQNAFFDIVDRALRGANAARDAEMVTLLDQWLQRPRRDFYIDLSHQVPVCGSDACQPVPVPLRPPTDFLWQRDPFQLAGGGSGIIESAGIDYLLPYWMGRYYGVITSASVHSAAAILGPVAPNSLASMFGTNLASSTAQSTSEAPPSALGGVTLAVTDAQGAVRSAPLLYVSPGQVNFVVPDGSAPGPATFVVIDGSSTQTAAATIGPVAPALFTMNGAGTGVAAATAITVPPANPALQIPVPVFQCNSTGCVSVPINLGVDTPVYVTFYGTGIRGRSSLANVSVSIDGTVSPVLYAGPSPGFVGLDQVNVSVPLTLRGSGEANVALKVDGQTSNTVTVNLR